MLDKFEIWIHDNLLKNDVIRHALYGVYQRVLVFVAPKFKYDGPIERLTPDDESEYLFGYYDKCPWSEDGGSLLALKVADAARTPDSTAPAEIVRIDLASRKIEPLAATCTWNVQQGCMLQWLSSSEILYNDCRENRYVSVILNLDTRTERILPMPVYAMSPDRRTALSLDFSRLHRLRPGYGYANLPETTASEKCPDAPCIWEIDIATGGVSPLLKYTDFATFEPKPEMAGAEHKVNHLMIAPGGQRFMVLHRWFQHGRKYTRLVTCNMDGTDMFNLSDDDFVSHCCWKNDREIISYLNKNPGGKGYWLLHDRFREFSRLWPQLAMDGHPSFAPDGSTVVTDTYPNRKRIQSLYIMSGTAVKTIARVFSPFRYGGDVRCDLHPRWSRDGAQICFDASFSGKRAIYAVPSGLSSAAENPPAQTGSPTITVVIPCYNCESTIDETLESLAAQSFHNFEVLCVNDGSTDGTLAKLRQWADSGRLPVRVTDQPNGGVSRARNHGIEDAHGTYLAFVDADDIVHPDYLRLLYNGIQSADAPYCRVSRRLADIHQCVVSSAPHRHQNQFDAMSKLLYEMGQYSFCCYLYSKERLNRFSIRFDENTKFGEDREFNWKYLAHCQSASWIDLPLYGYRVNPDSATRRNASWRKTDLLAAVKRIEAYLDANQCPFSPAFKDYMYPRAMWAVAKTFAVSRDRGLFRRLGQVFDVRTCMKRTAKDPNKLVAFASLCYLVAPSLFYRTVNLKP